MRKNIEATKTNMKTPSKNPDVVSANSTDTGPKQLKELAKKSVELARLVATNTASPEELLLELSRHSDEAVRRRIASNPSSPAKAAMAVGSQFPEELLNNPSFDLYILAEPNLLQGIGASALRALLKRDICPESFFAYAASQDDEATQLAVLTNANAPKSVVQSLLDSSYPRVQEATKNHVALQNPDAEPSNWQEEFAAGLLEEEKNRDKVPEAHKSLAYLLLCQVDELSQLTEAERWVVRTAWTQEERKSSFWMAKFSFDKENCPVSLLELIAKDPDKDLRVEVAGNPKLPESIQEILASDSESYVQEVLAGNENLSAAVMDQLTKSTNVTVRTAVASNPKISNLAIEILLGDKEAEVISALLKNNAITTELKSRVPKELILYEEHQENKEISPEVLASFAKDKAVTTRRMAASNSNTPEESLVILSKDKDKGIRKRIIANESASSSLKIEIFNSVLKDLKSEDKKDLARDSSYETLESNNASIPTKILEVLSQDPDEEVRKMLSRNENDNVTESILTLLAKDKSEEVREGVAGNKKSPINILIILSKDKEENVRARVASNLNCSKVILENLSFDKSTYVLDSVINNLNTPIDIIKKLASHKDENVRTSVARCSRGNADILKLLAKDSDSYVRRSVANPDNSDDDSNNKTPPEILQILATDEEADVRTAVAENINTPAELLLQLSKDKNLERYSNSKAITAVSGNPNTPKEALDYLASTYIGWLYKNAIPTSVKPGDLQKIMEDGYDIESGLEDRVKSAKKNKDLSRLRNEFISRMVAGSKPSISRCVAFLLPDCPPVSLAKYQRSSWWIERCAIAQNPNIPDSVLKQLLKDPNFSVQSSMQMGSDKQSNIHESAVIKVTTKERSLENNSVNWEIHFQKVLSEEDGTLVGDVDDSVYKSFVNLAYMFWTKIRKGQEISNSEMLFVKRSVKAHITSVALNPGTPIEIIDDLIKNSNSATSALTLSESVSESVLEKILNKPGFERSQYIAQNPNASLKILEKIAEKLLELKEDNFFGLMTAQGIANNPNCSVELLTKLAKSKVLNVDIKQAIASNPKTSPDVLTMLADDESHYVRLDVASNQNTPIKILTKMAKDNISCVRERIAENPITPKKVLEDLSKDSEESVREVIASNFNTPIVVLDKLSNDDNIDVLRALVKNPNTSHSVLKKLTALGNSKLNEALIENPNISTDLLENLAKQKDENEYGWSNFLEHPNISLALFEKIVRDADDRTLYNISSEANFSIEKLTILSKLKNQYGPISIATNPNLSEKLMHAIILDKREQVRIEVAKNTKLSTDLLKLLSKDKSDEVKSKVAENLSTSIEVLVSLSKEKDKEGDIRGGLARNPNTPPEILEELSKLADLKGDIAQNSSTPKNILQKLAIDDDPQVRSYIAANKNTPTDILRDLILEPYVEKSDDKDKILAAFANPDSLSELRTEYLKKLCAGLKPSYERVYGLLLPDCPPTVLTKCAKSAFWLERCAVASNPQTPAKLLQVLKNDNNPTVSGAAQR